MSLLFRSSHSKTLAPVEGFVCPCRFRWSWWVSVYFAVGCCCDVVRDVHGTAGTFVGCKSVPIFIGAWFLIFGGFFLAVVQFPWQRLSAACVLLVGLAVRIQSTCRVTESTQRARELTPGIIKETIEYFLRSSKRFIVVSCSCNELAHVQLLSCKSQKLVILLVF